ncbi:TetR-like C-terminal domain-containing protein [Jannaschia sp. LMIT008]|uniref:TetR/AcrR family transcriptional regulator n=1 Tax=Jannaschia maritima TaxID=3032585 RepID=UPI0028119708|nr:TetR-like C-terminal domain-containing protein [Jannaschia sp. LMIT008]
MDGTKTYHHGDLRGALLEAIRVLVERDGPDRFRIAEACRIAGVSTAAPYKHFADRGEMLRGVALAGMTRLRDAMANATAAHPPGDPMQIAALGRSYVDFAQREPGVFRLMFSLTEGHEKDAALQAVGDEAEAIVQRVVADATGLDPESQDARLRAYALWCFVHGHCFLTLDGKTDPLPRPAEDALLAMVGTRMLGG